MMTSTSWLNNRVVILGALVALALVATIILLFMRGAVAQDEGWPPFTMIYEIDAAPVSVGNRIQRGREVHRLEYQSETRWTDTVLEAPAIETSVGTFSRVGSYQRLDGRELTEFDAMDSETRSSTIDEGVTFVAGPALVRRPIEPMIQAGLELRRVPSGAEVCFGQVCEENARGLSVTDGGQERVFVDDHRGIPLRIGDSFFVVREVRIEDTRREVQLPGEPE